jgi:hypothetical protein
MSAAGLHTQSVQDQAMLLGDGVLSEDSGHAYISLAMSKVYVRTMIFGIKPSKTGTINVGLIIKQLG